MPLRRGFSRDIVSRNISEMVNAGHPRKKAVASTLKNARKSFRERNPGKPLPKHLQGRWSRS